MPLETVIFTGLVVIGAAIFVFSIADAIRTAGKAIAEAVSHQRMPRDEAGRIDLTIRGIDTLAEELERVRQVIMARDGIVRDPARDPAPWYGVTSLSAWDMQQLPPMGANPYRKARPDE